LIPFEDDKNNKPFEQTDNAFIRQKHFQSH
jgi:hypothetical protein